MKTENRDDSHSHTPSALNRVRKFIEGATLLFMTLRITDAFEGILSIRVDTHSVLHYVIFMLFYMSISFLYHKFKPM